MFAQLSHEGNTELADLVVGFALGIKVGSTLAAADVYWKEPTISGKTCQEQMRPGLKKRIHTASQRILEDLFKTQELEDREIDRRVKSQTALVRAQSRVELYAVTTVDLDLVLVVFPYHAKLDDSFRDSGNFEGGLKFWVLLEKGGIFKRGGEL